MCNDKLLKFNMTQYDYNVGRDKRTGRWSNGQPPTMIRDACLNKIVTKYAFCDSSPVTAVLSRATSF